MTFRRKLRRRIYSRIPESIRKHDFEIFTTILCLLGGVPLLFGKVEPSSMEATLPPLIVYIWGSFLSIGPVLILFGIFFSYRYKRRLADRLFWMRVEAFGLTCLAWAAVIYAVVLITSDVRASAIVAAITTIFGLTCFSREFDVMDKVESYREGVGLHGTIGK